MPVVVSVLIANLH